MTVSNGPITREEMIEMFGSEAPIEAINLIWNAPANKTLSDIRRELREIAAKQGRPQSEVPSEEAIHDVIASALASGYPTYSSVRQAARDVRILIGDGINNAFEARLSSAAQEASNPAIAALFPADIVEDGGKCITTLDASYNLQGALYDLNRAKSKGRPPDQVCINTIERVIGQLEAARSAVPSADGGPAA